MPVQPYRRRNLLVAALSAATAGVVAAALVLPAGLPQAGPAADLVCSGAAAQIFTSPPTGPTGLPSQPSWPPSPTPSPCPTPSTWPTPTSWPTPTGSPTLPPACPPLGDPPGYYERQLPLLHAASHIEATALGPVGPGYAGITIDVDQCRIDLYWKGLLPFPVASVVSLYDGPIQVAVHTDAPFAGAELDPQADRLVDDPSLALAAGIDIIRVGRPRQGTGVTVGVVATQPPPNLGFATMYLSQALHVPVSVGIEEPYGLSGRKDDRAPWYAGGRIKVEVAKDEYKECSTGWGIKIGRDEKAHMLTAAHCGSKGDKVFNGDLSRQLGTLADRDATRDSAIIDVTQAGGRMFTGRPNANASLPVDKAAEVKVGAWICDSGASTGQNCDIKVDAVNERIRTGAGWVRTTTSTHKDRNGIAGGTGDSGGPVYIPVEKDTKVQAVGIVVAGRNNVPCRNDDDTDTCGKSMAFVPIDLLLTLWNGTLVTG